MITQEAIRDSIRRYKESGLSVREFCSNEGIGRSTFYYRLKKHREKDQAKKTSFALLKKPLRTGSMKPLRNMEFTVPPTIPGRKSLKKWVKKGFIMA